MTSAARRRAAEDANVSHDTLDNRQALSLRSRGGQWLTVLLKSIRD
jgi:hypothetical protein